MPKKKPTPVLLPPEVEDQDADATSRSDFVRGHMKAARYSEIKEPGRLSLWQKYFVDPNQTSALVTALFRRDATERDPDTLEGFTVTVSMPIKATHEDIEKRAWGFIKEELKTLVNVFGPPPATKLEPALECPRCKKSSKDYVDIRGENICFSCYERSLSI